MTYGFISYLYTLKELLLILCSSGRNSRGVTAKQMDGAVPIFDPLLHEKIFLTNICLLLFRALFHTLTKPAMANFFFFRERKAVAFGTNKQLLLLHHQGPEHTPRMHCSLKAYCATPSLLVSDVSNFSRQMTLRPRDARDPRSEGWNLMGEHRHR